MTCSSNLRERITIQQEVKVADGGGGFTLTWTNIATAPTVWAEVKPVKGGEKVDAGAISALQTYLITLRYRTDITAAMQIAWGTIILNIRQRPTDRNMDKKFVMFEAQENVTA